MRAFALLLISVFGIGSLFQAAAAMVTYPALIPNGNNVVRNGVAWAAVGHVTKEPTDTTRNNFGLAFASAGHAWTTSLCQADSDSDGFTNGQELGDPNCVWTPGATPSRTSDISHPGFADSMPSTASGTPTSTVATPTLPQAPTAQPGAATTPAMVLTRVGLAVLVSVLAGSAVFSGL